VITGAASGLGRAIAVEIARRAGRIVLADIDVPGAEETAKLVLEAGGTCEVLRTDVGKADEMERVAELAEERWGGTDLLVNNAGVGVGGPVGDVPLTDWEWILQVNLWGVIHGCHVFVPRMKRQGSGFIINVASNAGIASLPEMAPYNVTKAGIISLSETLHTELARYSIRVSALCPTFFATNLLQTLRTPSPRQRDIAQALTDRSTCTATSVARAGLRGLERGELIVIPQLDGAVVWRLKRFAPGLYFRLLQYQQRRDVLGQLARRQSRRESDA
jgi:NAD(P)-dependent dehydrogenase (short-subunit alcohol dehydrogenase family)